MNDPLIEQENAQERLYKATQRALKDEEQRKADIENMRIDRLPYWMSPLADYDPLDAGNWPDEDNNERSSE